MECERVSNFIRRIYKNKAIYPVWKENKAKIISGFHHKPYVHPSKDDTYQHPYIGVSLQDSFGYLVIYDS